MDAISQSVVTSISHGYIETLLKNGLKPEWVTDSDARVVYEAATDLYRSGKKINSLAVLVKSSGKLQNISEIKTLFGMNGTGDVPAEDVVRQARDVHLASETKKLNDRVAQLLKQKPNEISKWLPILSQRIQSLTLNARAYDPRPSSHSGPVVQPVSFKSKLETYNKMWEGEARDGGGYREGWWRLWIGITGRGKTTTGYTLALDGIHQGKRVAFIAKENQKQVSARLLLALTHLTLEEVNKGIAIERQPMLDEHGETVVVRGSDGNILGPWHDASVRQHVLESGRAVLDSCVQIYGWQYFGAENIRNVMSWADPHILLLDYIGPEDVPSRMDVKFGLGSISASCEEIAHTSGRALEGFFQMSNQEARAYQKNALHVISGPYGSGAAIHPADEAYQTRKADLPYQQHYLRIKSRAGGDIDEFQVSYDRSRWIYMDPPEPPPIL